VELVELADWTEALTPDIQERVRNGSACELTKKYAVIDDGKEVGYLAVDWWPLSERTDLVLYELFVPQRFRHRGVGTRILAKTEELAKVAGYKRVFLHAQPLEDYPQEQLIAWYQMNGFTMEPNDDAGMAKVVS
jgi:GNAT superfamily N-acetyltransferase